MRAFVHAWSNKFDDSKYPHHFYTESLKSIETANSIDALAENIIGMLHWKDGKVVEDPAGDYDLNGVSYSLKNPKPNTYHDDKHKPIIYSRKFYELATTIRDEKTFDTAAVDKLTGSELPLWASGSVVIPTFVLHILSPGIYPLYDQHVERAKRALLAEELNQKGTTLKIRDYLSYREFFEEFLVSHYGKSEKYTLDQVKEIDKALWSFGKSLKVKIAFKKRPAEVKTQTIPRKDFKKRVIELIKEGHPHKLAFELAGQEFDIPLSRSQKLYPGSVIYQWRKQGYDV